MTRNRLLGAGVALVVAAGALGWLGGTFIASPAELAARAQPPEPSLVTVAVERRTLSADIVTRGDVGFSDPFPVALAGPVGEADARQVVTRLAERGQELGEGSVAGEVAGRPVFLLAGALPAYRDLRPGATGTDVRQLEEALVRLGHLDGADDTWTAATGGAVQSLYAAAGYVPRSADESEEEALAAARQRVRDANRALRDLSTGEGGATPRSQVLQARSDRDAAIEAVDLAELQRDRDDAAARGAVSTAQAGADQAAAASSLADGRYEQAKAGTNPDTGEPVTPVELLQFDDERAAAALAETEATTALADAHAAVTLTARQGETAVAAARRQLGVAEAALVEAQNPAGGGGDAAAREDLLAELREANDDLAELTAETGTWLPAGEVVFVPALPVQVASLDAELGSVVSGSLLTVAGASTGMRVAVRAGDLARISVGDRVLVDEPDLAQPLEGTITVVPERSLGGGSGGGSEGGDDEESEGSGGTGRGADERVEVEVALPDLPEELLGANVRVVIPVESTDGEVLVVPAAALSAVADGSTRVQVEDPDADGGTRTVTVATGLASGGDVEVRPLDGDLDEGDRVVVGLDRGDESGDGSEEDLDDDPDDDPGDEPDDAAS